MFHISESGHLYFDLKHKQIDRLTPDIFRVYQVFRPTSNITSNCRWIGCKNTIRLQISQVQQVRDNWYELIINSNNKRVTLEQIYNHSRDDM